MWLRQGASAPGHIVELAMQACFDALCLLPGGIWDGVCMLLSTQFKALLNNH